MSGESDEKGLKNPFGCTENDENLCDPILNEHLMLTEKVLYDNEKSSDELTNSADSLSSSASISDSDLTSTDSDDSLALSESESITDVTPLNSPYCDSPLPQSKQLELKSGDEHSKFSAKGELEKSVEFNRRPEVNILMQAVEKLEFEKQNVASNSVCCSISRKKKSVFSAEENKRLEQENQRLFKRAISQQSRIRSLYPMSNLPGERKACSELGKSDSDVSVIPKKNKADKWSPKERNCHALRQQKCLSHPASYPYSLGYIDKKSLVEEEGCNKNKELNQMSSIENEQHLDTVPIPSP